MRGMTGSGPAFWDARMGFALDLERVPLADRLVAADEYRRGLYQQGVVYLLVRDGALRYIGQTVSWQHRSGVHYAGGRDWGQAWLLLMPDDWPWEYRADWLDSVEYALIEHLDPPDNVRRRRPAGDLFDAVLSHLRETRFALPGGIVAGERETIIAQPVRFGG